MRGVVRQLGDAALRLGFVGWWLGPMAVLAGRGAWTVLSHGPTRLGRVTETILRVAYAGWWISMIAGLTWRGAWAVLRHGPRGLLLAAGWLAAIERRCAGS